MRKRVVMADVARLAGVSSQTVSRALSGKGPVKEETMERIQKAIEELNYRPDRAAQVLASGQSQSTGVLLLGRLSYGRALAFAALERCERRSGRFLTVASADPDNRSEIQESLNYLHDCKVRALVVIGQRSQPLDLLAPNSGVPTVVTVSELPAHLEVGHVCIDQRAGMEAVLRHLSQLQVKQAIHLSPRGLDSDAHLRRRYLQELAPVYGINVEVVDTQDWSSVDGYEAALGIGLRFDALICANDNLALGAAAALAHKFQLVPGRDYALTGFDDIETAAYACPPLTTVRQDFTLVAEAVVQVIDTYLESHTWRRQAIVPQLVVRESTAQYRGEQA